MIVIFDDDNDSWRLWLHRRINWAFIYFSFFSLSFLKKGFDGDNGVLECKFLYSDDIVDVARDSDGNFNEVDGSFGDRYQWYVDVKGSFFAGYTVEEHGGHTAGMIKSGLVAVADV